MGTWRLLQPKSAMGAGPSPPEAEGYMLLPAVPSLLEDHVQRVLNTFTALGSPLRQRDLARLRERLRTNMVSAFEQTPYAGVIVHYRTRRSPGQGLTYRVGLSLSTLTDEYAGWTKTREAPLFGMHPDAKVMDLANSLGVASESPVLDIGAGTGRNALPLARAGHPTHAIELSPDLAVLLRKEIGGAGLDVKVFEGDVLGARIELPVAYYRLIIACEVVSHFRNAEQVRSFMRRASELLAPGGLLAFSVFLADEDYAPDELAFELSQAQWCALYSRGQLSDAGRGLELELVSDESVYEYERQHLPKEAWPPTGWFADWSTGLDLFDLPREDSPIDMRWVVYRRP